MSQEYLQFSVIKADKFVRSGEAKPGNPLQWNQSFAQAPLQMPVDK